MTLLLGALAIGLILSLLALGVYIAFRVFQFADITAEGSVTTGGAVAAAMLVAGIHPVPANAAAFLAGALAGMITGILNTRFRINQLLSGILVMTALYSINLHIMGRSNIPLMFNTTLVTLAERTAGRFFSGAEVDVAGWAVPVREIGALLMAGGAAVFVAIALYLFFRTNIGTAMRASGDNRQMIRALGGNDDALRVAGLALANGLSALAGALLTQYQGFADVQMGIGMVVWGLASVIIGETLVGTRQLGFALAGAVMGSVLFRLLVAVALRWGLNPNDLKLITALFVFAALVLPRLMQRGKTPRTADA